MALRFQPSRHSYGAFDLAGVAARRPTGRLARPNRILGIALTKEAKYKKWADKERDRWRKYQECKGKKENKGKPIYEPGTKHHDPKGKCRSKYLKWEKAEAKRAQYARDYAGKLESKGQLTPDLAAQLKEEELAPTTLSPADRSTLIAAKKGANTQRAGKPGKGTQDINDTFQQSAAVGQAEADALGIDLDEEDEGGFPVWVLGLGAVAAIGGIAYFLFSGKPVEEADLEEEAA